MTKALSYVFGSALYFVSASAWAQPADMTIEARAAAADTWLASARRSEERFDRFGRHFVGVSASLLGAGLLVAAPLADLRPASTALYMTSGALLLTAAVSSWAYENPTAARSWAGMWWNVGLATLGGGFMLSSVDNDFDSGRHTLARRLTFTVGAFEVGSNLTMVVCRWLLPQESPAALSASLEGRSPQLRYARSLEFLRQQDRARLVVSVASTPWLILGGSFAIAFAHDASTSTGRALVYAAGSAVIALALVAAIYEIVRTPDWERLQAGEKASD